MREQVEWNGWLWNPRIDCETPSGKLLNRLTAAMSSKKDIQECGLLVFGSSPWEFGAGLPVNSGDIDVTPDQFYPIFGAFLEDKDFLTGNPHVQLCPPGVFRPGQMWSSRAVHRMLNGIEVTLPHPIDIIAGKLHRLDSRDYRGINLYLESTGRPTPQDMAKYGRENPDWLMSGSEKNQTVIANLETFHSYLGGDRLDVENDIIGNAAQKYEEALDRQPITARVGLLASRVEDLLETIPDAVLGVGQVTKHTEKIDGEK